MVGALGLTKARAYFLRANLWIHRLLMVCALVTPSIVGAELIAEVDATTVTTEQSLRLTITSDLTNHSNTSPDFSELGKDFEILGSSSQTNLQTIGQKMTQTRSWQLELLAKRVGTLQIPAFTLDGDESQAIEITVTAPRQRKPGESKGDYYMEAMLDRTEAYVQSQLLYTLRIFSVQNFLEGSLSEVEADGMTVVELGESRNYREMINGRAYQVLEKKFAMFPQRSGEITIPPMQLHARVPAAGARNRGIFTPSQTIRRQSEGFTVQVKPRPTDSGNHWWLPATAVQLAAQWEGDVASVRVGDSITRSLVLQAAGVTSTQLPELTPPQNPNFKLYANQPQLDEQAGEQGVLAVRQEKWALVALRPGELQIPEVKVPWFNTTTGQSEVAIIPAETLVVLPAEQGNLSATAQPALPNQSATAASSAQTLQMAQQMGESTAALRELTAKVNWWQRMTLALGALWLLSITALVSYGLYRRADRRQSASGASPRKRKPSLDAAKRAGRAGDARACAQSVLDWASEYWPEDPPRNLVSVGERLNSADLDKQLRQLDSALYAATKNNETIAAESLSDLVDSLSSVQVAHAKTHGGAAAGMPKASALPEL